MIPELNVDPQSENSLNMTDVTVTSLRITTV